MKQIASDRKAYWSKMGFMLTAKRPIMLIAEIRLVLE